MEEVDIGVAGELHGHVFVHLSVRGLVGAASFTAALAFAAPP
ncbi:MAG: hypothetical protein NW215_03975 [Hyphomicrobiales bacterium]|nr:hypothetical protein [Hyphomicrobiales bacterium]